MNDILVPVFGGMFDSTEVIETVGGFPRGNKAVDSSFFAKMISCFYKNGVWREDSFEVTPAGGLSVSVGEGIGWIEGYMAWQTTPALITLEAGGTYMIALRLNKLTGEFDLLATSNTAGMPKSEDGIFDLVLCTVTVPSGATTVTADMITDTRGDVSLCGYVTSAIDALGIVAKAADADSLGGAGAESYLKKSGGEMSGSIIAATESTGAAVVRNISYGTTLPASLSEGEIFILVD